MSKVLYFNGCSWSNGSELSDIRDRTSELLSEKLGYEKINESQDGKTNQHIIEETINFAYDNEHNKDNIIINV